MFRRIIWNDLRKSPTISATMLLFITAAAVLISLAVTLGLQLAGSPGNIGIMYGMCTDNNRRESAAK